MAPFQSILQQAQDEDGPAEIKRNHKKTGLAEQDRFEISQRRMDLDAQTFVFFLEAGNASTTVNQLAVTAGPGRV